MDRYRRDYYRYHTGKKWKNPENYELCLNPEKLGYEETKDLIMEYVKRRTGNNPGSSNIKNYCK